MRCSPRSPTTPATPRSTASAAYETARYCLMDTLACGFQALKYPACREAAGAGGARARSCPAARACPAPPTSSIRCRPRSTSARWCAGSTSTTPGSPPSGAIRPTTSAASSRSPTTWRAAAVMQGLEPPTVRDVLTAMIKAHEIQGVLALENSFNRVGLDHVLLVRVASTAVVTSMLGGTREQVVNAVSNAWIDGGALRTYRHAPNTGSRKSWAAGDATSRAVRLALIALTGEMGYPSALIGQDLGLLGRAVQGQAAAAAAALRQLRHGERAVQDLLPGRVPRADRGGGGDDAAPAGARAARGDRAHRDRDPGARACASSTRPARSPIPPTATTASSTWWRSRCIFGRLTAEDYEDKVAADPRIDAAARQDAGAREPDLHAGLLRPRQALHRQRRAGVLQRRQRDASACAVDFPIGHRKRRAEGMPVLVQKFQSSVDAHFAAEAGRAHQGAVRQAERSWMRCR